MKSLDTLIKLQKSQVDEQRQLLAKLQARLDEVHAAIERLTMEQALEQVAAHENPTYAVTYDQYVKRAIQRGRQLEKQKRAAEIAVNFARDKLVELFEEQKRYEIADRQRRERADAEERRKERLTLDEVGSVRYARKKKAQEQQ